MNDIMKSTAKKQGFTLIHGALDKKDEEPRKDFEHIKAEWKDKRIAIVSDAASRSGELLSYTFAKRLHELKRDRSVIPISEGEMLLGNAPYRREAREGGEAFYNESKLGLIDSFKHIAMLRIPKGVPDVFNDLMEQLARSYRTGRQSLPSKIADMRADRQANRIRINIESLTVFVVDEIKKAQTPSDLKIAFVKLERGVDRIIKEMSRYRKGLQPPMHSNPSQ